jgi:hypothetical protein
MPLPPSAKAVPLPHCLAWRTIPIPRDLPLAGWIAGAPFGVHVHHVGQVSKPCWRKLTLGTLRCPWCAETKRRLVGYVPLLTFKDHARRVVIVSKTILPSVEALPLWSPVVCLTPRQRGMPSVIRPTDDCSLLGAAHTKLLKRPGEDIREYLIRVLWRVPEICEHFDLEPWSSE